MTASASLTAHFSQSVKSVGKPSWDDCAGRDNPFVSYDFLNALEESGCVTAETGWQPYHITIHEDGGGNGDGNGDGDREAASSAPLAAMPLYVKSHSYGEYVFDHAWANAYERAGGHYYPKLQSSVPFSPVNGPRLLVNPTIAALGADRALKQALVQAAADLTDRMSLSSLHLTFLTADDATVAGETGLLLRNDQQFHWRNRGFGTFDDFLGSLSSRKRKQIRKERHAVAEAGVEILHLTGADITEDHWDHFYSCYLDTGARKWGQPYLNRYFFSLLGQTMADRILLMECRLGGQPVASALNFIGSDTLYGRYWGCTDDIPCLHFEACYYQAIDYAIEHGLAFVEAGAQGPHKLARGYEPVKTVSAHYLRDPGFRDAVARFLEVERQEVDAEIDYLGDRTPFKKTI